MPNGKRKQTGARVERLRMAARRWAGLLILSVLAFVLLSSIWLHNRSATDSPASVGSAHPATPYEAIVERAQLNAALLPRLQYSMAQEAQSRDNKSATAAPNQSRSGIDLAVLRADWPAYLRLNQQKTLAALHLNALDMHAPLDVVRHHTLEMSYENAGYAIDVLTWQAAPGIYMPAVLYRPQGRFGRLPVVIMAPGCHEDVASHDAGTNMQRRMANFVLSGMIVFTTEGFCDNGVMGPVPGNQRRFDYYTLAGGSGISNNSLEIAVCLRALDYLATRADTDMSRVGVTGYSNGAVISKHLARVTNRIAAVAVVSSSFPETSNSDLFSDARDNNNIFTKPSNFYNGWQGLSPFDVQPLPETQDLGDALSKTWSSDQLKLALSFGTPRPVYFVLGSRDAHYSILDAENGVEQMQQPWKDIGASVLPTLDVVDAVHGYNAEQQDLVRQWFMKVLKADPLLPPPDGVEYKTPILSRKRLEVTPAQFPGVTLHDLYSALALKTILARREESPLRALSRGDAAQRVENLLGLPQLRPGATPRPILLDDTTMPFNGRAVRFQYWLVGSEAYLRSGLLLLFDEHSSTPRGDIDLTLSTADSVPSEADLQTALDKGDIVAVVIAPGYGPLAPSQSTTGNFARQQAKGFTLTGMGVSTIERSVDLLRIQWPDSAINLHANGVDAGNMGYFAVALDPRIDAAWVTEGMASFESLLTAPTQPYVPPTLVIPGILASVSVDDLRWLASPREIHILSESDLSEFHPAVP
jgi:dienelactone hydrolase